MNLFRRFAQYARASNQKSFEEDEKYQREYEERKHRYEMEKLEAEIEYENSKRCCANCKYYIESFKSCTMHKYDFARLKDDIEKDPADEYVCSYFFKKT